MNIKKVFTVVLCFALSFCISISVFAEVNLDDFAYYADDGSLQYDMDAYYYAYAQDLVLHSGVDIDPSDYWIVSAFSGEIVGYNYDLFKADYDSAIASLAPEPVESSSVSGSTVEDVSVDNISIEDNADDDLNYDTPIESEDTSVPDLLETSENNTELEYREDTPMVYLVNDLRSGSVSSSTYSLKSSNSDLTYEDIWGHYTNRQVASLDKQHLYFHRSSGWQYWAPNGDIINCSPEIDLINKYIYFPESNQYIDSHWIIHDSVPEYTVGDSYESIWGGSKHEFASEYLTERNIDFISLYYDSTYQIGTSERLPLEVNLDKRYIFLPEANIYITDNWQISDTEPIITVPDIEVDLTGTLKDLIISIFGEYEPILTPTTFTETIDNVTTTTIIDAVASGSAGVDWEWCAGVFLFGIMLFCLFKLLGGIIS